MKPTEPRKSTEELSAFITEAMLSLVKTAIAQKAVNSLTQIL